MLGTERGVLSRNLAHACGRGSPAPYLLLTLLGPALHSRSRSISQPCGPTMPNLRFPNPQPPAPDYFLATLLKQDSGVVQIDSTYT